MIELLSDPDTLDGLKNKLADWISNEYCWRGSSIPHERQVLVYRPGQEPELFTGRKVTAEGPVDGFELDLAPVWKWGED